MVEVLRHVHPAFVIGCGISLLMVAGRGCHPVRPGGDRATEAPEVNSMQHPILTALDGGAQTVAGEVVLAGIGTILNRLLPDVPQTDPLRPALVALAFAADCQPTESRAHLEAL